MKKFLLFSLMGLVMLGNFTSCKKDKQEKEFKKNIVGKWKTYSSEDSLRVTDRKNVCEFFSDGTITTTKLRDGYWICSAAASYTIKGDRCTIKFDDGIEISAIIESLTNSFIQFVNGYVNPDKHFIFHEYTYERVTVDYKQSVIGLWEGVSLTGDETYGAADHRWKFNADGTYVYLTKNIAGEWEADPSNTGNIYYVEGNYYGSRWLTNDVEYREWWDIDYCNDTEMRWSALRQKEDGSYFTTTLTMKRVNE